MRWGTFLAAIGILLMCFSSGFSEAAIMVWKQSGGSVGASRIIMQVNSVQGNDGAAGFTNAEANKLIESWQRKASYKMQAEVPVQAGKRSEAVQIAGIGGDYTDFATLWLSEGSMVTKRSMSEDSNIVVLSEGLAERLFGSTDVVGMEITILNKKFQIIGVYRKDNHLLEWMTIGTKPEVLLPAGVLSELLPELRVGTIELQASDAILSGERDVQVVLQANKLPLDGYTIQIGDHKMRLMQQLPRLLPSLAGLLVIGLSLLLIRKLLLLIFWRFRLALQMGYASDAWRQESGFIWTRAIACVGLAVMVVILWPYTRYSFYIPSEMIPERWIDLHFFKTKLFEFWREKPVLAEQAFQFQLMESRLRSFVPLLTVIGILLGLPLFLMGIREWRLAGLSQQSQMTTLFYCMAASYVFTNFTLILAGMPQLIQPGLWITIFGFCIIAAIYNRPKRKDVRYET